MSEIYEIICPNCKIEKLIYTTLKGLRYSEKNKVTCKKCKTLLNDERSKVVYERFCPECKGKLVTKNKHWNIRAIKENRLCLSCAGKKFVFTEEWRKNMSKNHADFSGKNNPFYGKTHSDEVKDKLRRINLGKDRMSEEYKGMLSTKMKGKNNPFYGKTHSDEVIKILSMPKTEEHKRKLAMSLKGNPGPNKGKIFTDETRKKMRISAIKRIQRDRCVISTMCPSVNKKEIVYFENMEKKNNWDGVFYGKNGNKTQFLIEELGYFVDYYEPKLNIVVEYDETAHYNEDWILKEKDVKRMNEIKQYLKCKFFRYNEVLNKFYEV
jgi:hypothetical protein